MGVRVRGGVQGWVEQGGQRLLGNLEVGFSPAGGRGPATPLEAREREIWGGTGRSYTWKHESGCMYLTLQWPSGILYAWKTQRPPSREPELSHRSIIPPGATLALLVVENGKVLHFGAA